MGASAFFQSDAFWTAASTVATFFAGVVALALPFLQQYLRRKRNISLVLDELTASRSALDLIDIMHEIRRRNGRDEQLSSQLHFMTSVQRKISTRAWDAFRYDLPAEQMNCFKKAYGFLEGVQHPEYRVSNYTESPDEDKVSAFLMLADLARVNYDKLSGACRYFRP